MSKITFRSIANFIFNQDYIIAIKATTKYFDLKISVRATTQYIVIALRIIILINV